MKRILVLSFFSSIVLSGHADPVSLTDARNIADKVLSGSRGIAVKAVHADMGSEVKTRMAVTPVAEPAFYTFNASDGKGFVIVAGDDDFPSVIGYSAEGCISSAVDMPPALVSYLESYSRYVADVRSGIASQPVYEKIRLGDTSPVVAPLCSSVWDQTDPFNYYCPKSNGKSTPVGCTATAMSQIMYKWKHPERAKGLVVYNSGLGVISEDLGEDKHIYQWDAMKSTAAQNRLPSSRNAVAQLCYDCGIAAKMQYEVDGSGAYDEDAMIAFYKNFSYNAETIRLIYRDFVADQAEWNTILRDELDSGRPVLFSASSSVGSGGDAAGHAFVIDGYDSDGFVHVNWGWGGYCDGYFDVTKLDPEVGYAYTEWQSMIIGIVPGTGEETEPQTKLVIYDTPICPTSSVAQNTPFDVTITSLYNWSLYRQTWTVGVGLFSKDGKFLEIISTDNIGNTLTLKGGYGYESYSEPILCKIPSSYSDGDYVLRFMTRQKGFDEWVLPDVVGGDKKNRVPAHIVSGTVRFNEVSVSVDRVSADAVLSRTYFDVGGRQIVSPVKGQTVVEVVTYSDGSTRSVKRVF